MEYKRDSKLGQDVHNNLVSLGLETPFTEKCIDPLVLERQFNGILTEVGLDLTDDSLTETPARLAKLYSSEFFAGLNYENFPKATVVSNKMHYDEMVLERNIQVYSLCEHHFLPIVGGAHVAYIPDQKVMGLSKLNRVVEFFCRRPQIQERLTSQIHSTLCYLLETDNVAVIINAEHMCVKLRGVLDPCSDTITSQLTGKFRDPAMRHEFITLCGMPKSR